MTHFIWCQKKEWHTDTYDLGDPAVRQKLIQMGFVARIPEKSDGQ